MARRYRARAHQWSARPPDAVRARDLQRKAADIGLQLSWPRESPVVARLYRLTLEGRLLVQTNNLIEVEVAIGRHLQGSRR